MFSVLVSDSERFQQVGLMTILPKHLLSGDSCLWPLVAVASLRNDFSPCTLGKALWCKCVCSDVLHMWVEVSAVLQSAPPLPVLWPASANIVNWVAASPQPRQPACTVSSPRLRVCVFLHYGVVLHLHCWRVHVICVSLLGILMCITGKTWRCDIIFSFLWIWNHTEDSKCLTVGPAPVQPPGVTTGPLSPAWTCREQVEGRFLSQPRYLHLIFHF